MELVGETYKLNVVYWDTMGKQKNIYLWAAGGVFLALFGSKSLNA